jgi:hypothetical protein
MPSLGNKGVQAFKEFLKWKGNLPVFRGNLSPDEA